MTNNKIVLHIGMGKTGTSSIQRMLFENRKILETNGVFYPDIGLYQYAHHHFALYNKDVMPSYTRDLLKKTLDIYKDKDCHTMLMSSEQFFYCKNLYLETLKEIFKDYDVKIILFVRKQIEYIISSFLQKLKEGSDYHNNIESFYNIYKEGFDYSKRIEPWEELFGTENITVRLYDREITSDACDAFLRTLGYNFIYRNSCEYRENKSLAIHYAPLIKKIDDLGIRLEDRAEIIDILLNLPLPSLPADNSWEKKVYHDFHESNKRFATKYLSPSERELFLKSP